MDGNRTIYATIVGLALVLIIGSAVGGGSKSKSAPAPPAPPINNARAVVIDGGDVDRQVVVSPCHAPTAITEQDVQQGRSTPNAVALDVPADAGPRVVLVPDCVKPPPKEGEAGLPAAAFVLPAGSEAPGSRPLKVEARTQVLVPGDSRVERLIVPPCTGEAPKQDVVVSPAEGEPTTVAIRRC